MKTKQNKNATTEINGNFYCTYCRHIKDYSEDLCENCYTKEYGYFTGFEFGRNPIFENG